MTCYHVRASFTFSFLGISVGTFSYIALSLFLTSDAQALNIIIGTTNSTAGTEDDDVIIGCSHLEPQCSQGSILFGLDGDDSLQGSTADDWVFGDEGNDKITGADGNDKLFGGSGKDLLQGGFGGDFLYGGPEDDELYSGPGDDVLIGGKGSDYFDCGEGYDTIIDFEPLKGDTKAENCEISLTHSPNDIEFSCYGDNLVSSAITQLTNSTISMNNGTSLVSGIIKVIPDELGTPCNALKQDESISLSSSSSVLTSNRKSNPTTDYEALIRN